MAQDDDDDEETEDLVIRGDKTCTGCRDEGAESVSLLVKPSIEQFPMSVLQLRVRPNKGTKCDMDVLALA